MDKDVNVLKEQIAEWIKQKVKEYGAKGAVVGLSGGIDSSVVASLAKKALGENVLGVIMPCHSHGKDEEHAKMLAEKMGIKTEYVDLGPVFDKMRESVPSSEGIPTANIKPRLRMTTLYYFANMHNYIVLGTDNKDELMVGYFTKYGEGGVDLLPIASLYKNEVRELGKALGVPEEIISKSPSAGLWSGQTDEGELGITYDELDKILHAIENNQTEGIDSEKLEKVRKMIKDTEHKRRMPEVFGS
ncbi:MAG: NAD+ synthase [Candidatus Aenigmatarchaeota archaeon]|nr:MAG: NAD+ synthase [Candidatus Aenigmarchaeota archaeon]